MSTLAVDTDAEGFLTDPQQWSEGLAEEIARENGIPELTDAPLARDPVHARPLPLDGQRALDPLAGKESGVPIKELYQLFPKGPAKLAAKIGGIPKPKGCI